MASALKSETTVISIETNPGEKIFNFFSRSFHTDQWNKWVENEQNILDKQPPWRKWIEHVYVQGLITSVWSKYVQLAKSGFSCSCVRE